jgi:dolichol-phosphate mannosyltransferase
VKKIVIIPTFNEKENIAAIIHAVIVLGNQYHVLVVDDGSPDGTASIVKDLMQTHPDKIFIQERKGKLGLGSGYILGFNWGV